MLNDRRIALSNIPENLRSMAKPYVKALGTELNVLFQDNRLDAHLGHIPGWYSDWHPNLGGYQVIASETAKFLAPLIRARLPQN